ncbi:MAG: hypothetical protein DRH15_05065 [Deltaproteobacteria bacterium]|nr:MAG: hypothetical protein DRH15_05065 [Deltaproteobacteria bacterium]
MSNAVHGIGPVLYHTATYPAEFDFSATETTIIRKIRRLIGDLKELSRIYSDGTEFCSYITDDGHSIELENRGWPLYVSIDDVEYTDLSDPVVNGYQYLTFSGTLLSGSSNPKIDVWYHTFKFSDREIYEAYGDAMIPANVPTDCVSQDHLILQAAIDLLESMTADDMITDGASIRDDASVYDPSPGLRARSDLIDRLRNELNGLVEECIKNSMLALEGVLID